MTAFLIVLADPITTTVFGDRWHGAVAAAQVLCLWAVMSPISMVCGNAFMSRGRANLLFMLAVPQAIALVVGSLIAAPSGIVAVSWVQAGIAITAQVVTLAIAKRMFDLSLASLLERVHAAAPGLGRAQCRAAADRPPAQRRRSGDPRRRRRSALRPTSACCTCSRATCCPASRGCAAPSRRPPVMTDSPRVSVLMPAYNAAATVAEAVASALAQTVPSSR